MLTAVDAYRKLCRSFRWEIPEHFNFGAVVDGCAADTERAAILWEDRQGNRARLTFADLSAQSNRIANVLTGLGLRRGEPVLLVLPRITLWQAAYLGALKAGVLVIPCTAMLRENDLVYRANHSQARAVISVADKAEMVADLRSRCPSLSRFLIVGSERSGWASLSEAMLKASARFSPVRTRAREPAICYYTSGTTGEPKAVLHGHGYAASHRLTGLYWLDLKADDLHWTTSDTGWAKAAYGVLFGPWMNGVTTFMYNGRFEPRRELELLERYRITTFCAPPTEYRMLIKEDLSRYKLSALRHCTAAGEPLNPEALELWRDRFKLTIHDGYGQTETIIMAANVPGVPVKPGSMGLPFVGHDLKVLDADLNEAGDGEVGELALRVAPERPPSLFLEYWKDPQATATVFRGDYYLTGDLARRDADGYLWFVGRADDLIISAGYRIGPFEVESALLEHAAVLESAVVASPDPERGAIVKAFVRLKSGAPKSSAMAEELKEHVKRVTAPYKHPREIEFIDELPKTASGKIRRVELRRLEEERKRGPS